MEFNERIQFLIRQVDNKQASAEELEELLSVLQSGQYNTLLQELDALPDPAFSATPNDTWLTKINTILQADKTGLKVDGGDQHKPFYRLSFFKYVAAASVVLIATALFLFLPKHRTATPVAATIHKVIPTVSEIKPGSYRASLQLSNGAVIILDSLSSGNIAKEGSTSIVKQTNGKIVYQADRETGAANLFNRMSTPIGGQYQLVLPDGTKVWMNASSSIKYPVRFAGNERRVEIQGELYFEVAQNAQQPFIVDAGNHTEIKVVGTHFNVNTYSEEEYLRTTLLEGAIHVSSVASDKLLKPGEQAEIDHSGKLQLRHNVDLNAVVAWKNGLFNFNRSNTHEVMNQLARWYDIEVKYDGRPSDQMYGGEIQRDLNLSQVLNILRKSGMHCRLDNRVLTVMP